MRSIFFTAYISMTRNKKFINVVSISILGVKWHLIVFLNVIHFLMTNDIEHIVKWLSSICIFVMQLKKTLFSSFLYIA